MTEKIADIERSDDDEIALRFPFSRFQEFLFGFLKSREVLRKEYDVDFVAVLADLEQFHHLLTQKTEQNKFITAVSFEIEITFDDKTTRTLYGLEALQSFTETKNVAVNSVHLKWAFVRQEDADDIPQKQTVSLLLETVISIIRPGAREPVTKNMGKIVVKIEHTDQIWSGEVLNHFENQIARINANYSKIYRFCRFLRQYRSINRLVWWATILSAIGVGYISFQWSDLTKPPTRDREVYFDLSNALKEGELGSAVSKDTPDYLIRLVQLNDQKVVLQYFVIRDLLNDREIGVLSDLNKANYFHKSLQPVVTKIIDGYYDDKTKSEKLRNAIDVQLKAEKASYNIRFAYNYVRWLILFVFLYVAATLYLFIFANKSVIAITPKSAKIQRNQERLKANYLQIAYGVVASLLAVGIVFFFNLVSLN